VISTNNELNERELKETAVDHVLDNNHQYGDDIDYEALGLALYTENVVTGERDDIGRSDISSYLAENDLDDQRFIEYKADLASDYDEFVDFMGDFIDMRDTLVDDIESEGVFYQALYEEARNERNNAEQALVDILDLARDARSDSDWLEGISEIDPGQTPEVDRPDTDDPETDLLGTERPDTSGPDTGSNNFSTWSNYNFGTQAVGGMSTWSNYNFGTQVDSRVNTHNTATTDPEDDDWEIEAIQGELNEEFFKKHSGRASADDMPFIYNPQIKVSPEINIDGTEWTPDLVS